MPHKDQTLTSVDQMRRRRRTSGVKRKKVGRGQRGLGAIGQAAQVKMQQRQSIAQRQDMTQRQSVARRQAAKK